MPNVCAKRIHIKLQYFLHISLACHVHCFKQLLFKKFTALLMLALVRAGRQCDTRQEEGETEVPCQTHLTWNFFWSGFYLILSLSVSPSTYLPVQHTAHNVNIIWRRGWREEGSLEQHIHSTPCVLGSSSSLWTKSSSLSASVFTRYTIN